MASFWSTGFLSSAKFLMIRLPCLLCGGNPESKPSKAGTSNFAVSGK